ncbi:DNA helicase [Martensiomyces pterosporus]|nr:DNA helicase [Martensiomyces pterosporus]
MDVEEFTRKHIALVERERDYEVEQSRALQANWSPTHLQRLGYALVGLRITGTRTGLGGRLLLTLESSVVGDPLPPSTLRSGDIVGVGSPSNGKGKKEESTRQPLSGVISHVSEAKLVVALSDDAEIPSEWNERCTVTKLANDITYRRILHALKDLASMSSEGGPKPALHRVLFSSEVPQFTQCTINDEEFIDQSLNDSQKEAVRLAVTADEIALIHGPPGTGKTHTMVEIIRQLASRGKRLLVCGPSNVSVDNLVERLGRLRGFPMVRLGHPARLLPAAIAHSLDAQTKYSEQGELLRDVRKELDETLAKIPKCKRYAERRELYSNVRLLRKEFRTREAKVIDQTIGNSTVVLATLNGAASRDLAKHRGKFDAVIIDEGTQAMEGECWIAALQAPKLILAGDHHQLPPTIKSLDDKGSTKTGKDGTADRGQMLLLETTLFERVRERFGDACCCMLTTQYRMNEDIMRVSSDELYDGKLVADPSVASHVLSDLENVESTEDTDAPLVLIDTAGAGMGESTEDADSNGSSNSHARMLADTDSKLNQGEASLATQHVDKLVAAGVAEEDIAVISPYNAQVRLLKTLIRERHPGVEIGSVDGFQGREKEAVVLSLVRSNSDQEIGFLSDYRRINVAITRPRRHLCLIADSETVAMRNPFLKALFAHLEETADLRYADQM